MIKRIIAAVFAFVFFWTAAILLAYELANIRPIIGGCFATSLIMGVASLFMWLAESDP